MSTYAPSLKRNEPIVARRPAPAPPQAAKPAPKKERPEDILTLRLRGEGKPAVVTMMNGLTIEGVILYVGRYSYLLRTSAGKEFEVQKTNVCWVTAARRAHEPQAGGVDPAARGGRVLCARDHRPPMRRSRP